MRFYYLILVIVLPSLFFPGCVENNVAPGTGNVIVHMYDGSGLPYNHCYITTGINPLSIPEGNGKVSLQVPSVPFNLYVEMRPGLVYMTYDNVKSSDLNIILTNAGHKFGKENYLYINFPVILKNQERIIQFISNNYFYGFAEYGGGNFLDSLDIYDFDFPPNIGNYNGKIIIIIYTFDTLSGKIISYDNCAEKDVKLNDNSEQSISFTSDDFKNNLGSTNFSFQIQIPINSRYSETRFTLCADGANSESDIYLNNSELKSGNIIVPTGLPFSYKIKMYNQTEEGDYSVSKWIKVPPDLPGFLDNSILPDIFLPIDDAENISDTSAFCYDDNNNKGIYYLLFNNENSGKIFVTDKNKITLGELKKAGLKFSPNTLYTWYYDRYSEFNSIDDFLSQPYILNPNYNSIITSASRIFRMAP